MGLSFTEPKHREEFLLTEARGSRSRETVLFGSSADVGQILGKRTLGAAALAIVAIAGQHGNGVLVADPASPLLAGAVDGKYTVRFTSATVAEVNDPHGERLGELTLVGGSGTFADQVKVEATAGATPFQNGDGFDVTVSHAAGDGAFVPLNLTAVDGSQYAAAISLAAVVVPESETGAGVVVLRDCEVMGLSLEYPASATSDQMTAINVQLATRRDDHGGIIVRYPQGQLVSA